jgi:haloalkane dehalogenase
VVASNTGLPVGASWSEGFRNWLDFSQRVPQLPIGFILNGGTKRGLSDAERAAYEAPFPEEIYKEGARQFPTLVPITAEHASVAENKAAWAVLERFDKPFITAFSDGDPVTAGGEAQFQARVPGAAGQAHVTLSGGHFVQEDSPAEIADLLHRLAQG